VVAPDAVDSLQRIRGRGIKTAVVSNFDTRLHRILRELGVHHLWDAVICSADWGAEKPNPVLFQAAFEALGLPPDRCLHVGDDRRNDVYGARDSGCFALLWGQDVACFAEVERRIATGNLYDSLDDA
jgi:HAD superfamily hydrolase (TIGR01549 family)